MLGIRDLIPFSRSREMMTPARSWEHPLVGFQREMERLFDEVWRSSDLPLTTRHEALVSPRIDVHETDDAIVVSTEVPGMDEKDVEVLLTDDVLTIKGEKRAEETREEKGRTYTERHYGHFERRIALDSEVIGDKVDAKYENGVLTVTLPKAAEAKKTVKRIDVKGTAKDAAKAETEEPKAA